MKHLFYILFLLFAIGSIKAQELPPIENFTPEDYGGENQNWMIAQAPNNYMYIANNEGLIEYNGADWTLYPSPNKTIIRSVIAVENRIYTGCYMEFGYWVKDEFGKLQYYSLVDTIKTKMIEDEQIWNIINFDKWVLFQSLDRIYIYDVLNKNFEIIDSDKGIVKIFEVNNSIYYQEVGKGVFLIEEGKPKIIIEDIIVKEYRVLNIFTYNNNLLIQTREKGFFMYENEKLSKWNVSANELLSSTSVYSSVQLNDKSFILGTISKGIVALTADGKISYQINQSKGLGNNTVLSLFVDANENLWAGLDNGIDCVNLKSPIRIYKDDKGELGTVYASTVFDNSLYLGTNQGLFYKKLNSKESFQFIEGTKGQVWCLVAYSNELFCGHNSGTFLINKEKAKLISSDVGTWDIKPIPTKPNTLIQGTYTGLNVLEKKNNQWRFKNKIKGFENSSRFFEFVKSDEIWINHEYKGVFKLKVASDYSKITNVSIDTSLVKGKNSSLVRYRNNLLYAYKEGVFKYDTIKRTFFKDTLLSELFNSDNFISGKLITDKSQKLWTFSKDNIKYVTSGQLTDYPKINSIPIPVSIRKGMIGYENIYMLEDNKYLLGTSNGYIILDISELQETSYKVNLNTILLKSLVDNNLNLSVSEKAEIKYKQNSIQFNFSVPEYNRFILTEYQYKLEGLYNKWSVWTKGSKVFYENLPYNNYTFKVRARVGNKTTNEVSYEFKIERPWYLSNTAIVVYLLSNIVLISMIHRAYKGYYNKQHQHKQLENEQLIMRIKNEKLNQDIESKNRELAISTMSIIKKNEVLSSIKKELKSNESNKSNTSVTKLIDRNLNDAKDWKFFEEAFNNADKDFLDKVKKVHPNLTPNDLRFCAYLRLNLSSKEIAPLLNISVRSVEIKRYRLRKKMNLEHQESLVSHILEI